MGLEWRQPRGTASEKVINPSRLSYTLLRHLDNIVDIIYPLYMIIYNNIMFMKCN